MAFVVSAHARTHTHTHARTAKELGRLVSVEKGCVGG